MRSILFSALAATALAGPPCSQFNVSNLETPCYASVFNSSSYEIRAYAVVSSQHSSG